MFAARCAVFIQIFRFVAGSGCVGGFEVDGYCIEYVSGAKKTFANAKAACENNGKELLKLYSKAMTDAVIQYLLDNEVSIKAETSNPDYANPWLDACAPASPATKWYDLYYEDGAISGGSFTLKELYHPVKAGDPAAFVFPNCLNIRVQYSRLDRTEILYGDGTQVRTTFCMTKTATPEDCSRFLVKKDLKFAPNLADGSVLGADKGIGFTQDTCAYLCKTTPLCVSFNFNRITSGCSLFGSNNQDFEQSLISDSDNVYGELQDRY